MNTWSWQGRLQLSLSLSTLFHWDRSSCWPGSLLFGLSWLPRKSCGLLVSAFQHLGTPGFSCGFWGFKLRSLGLPSKCFYPLSHFPRSYWQLFLKIKLKPSWTTVVWRDGMSFCHFFFFYCSPPVIGLLSSWHLCPCWPGPISFHSWLHLLLSWGWGKPRHCWLLGLSLLVFR